MRTLLKTLLLLLLTLISCSKKAEGTFPFSQTEKIEIISYPVRYEWDSIRNGKPEFLGVIVKEKRLIINPEHIKERVILNDKQKEQLFRSLFIRNDTECSVASCFDPRHAILFYNRHTQIIAHIEICFDCGQDRGSFEYNHLCYEGLGDISKIFKDAGIKYYGE